MKKITIIFMSLTLISNFLGLFRDIIIAYFFGVSSTTDALNIAMFLPDMISSWFILILSSLFIPFYLDLEKKKLNTHKFVKNLIKIVGIINLSFIFVIYLNLDFFIKSIAPELSNETNILTINLSKVMICSIIFNSLLNIYTGLLHIKNSYLPTALLGILNNLVLILSVVILYKFLGAYSFAIGYLLGSVSRLVFLRILVLKKENIEIKKTNSKNLKLDREVIDQLKNFFIISLPLIFTNVLSQTVQVFERRFLSSFGEGAISTVYYSKKIIDVPNQVIGGVISAIILTKFSKINANNDNKQFIKELKKSLSIVNIFVIPITFLIILNNFEIVSIMFGRGNFTKSDIESTSRILSINSLLIIATCMQQVLNQAFYSMNKSKLIFLINLGSVPIFFITYYVFKDYFNLSSVVMSRLIYVYLAVFISILVLKKIIKKSFLELNFLLKNFSINLIAFLITLQIKNNFINNFNQYVEVFGNSFVFCFIVLVLAMLIDPRYRKLVNRR